MKMVEKFPTYSSYHFAENYFTVFNVLEGVKALLEVQFGLQGDFVMCPSEETWSNDIVKGTLKKQGAVVGVIYFDLFQRPGKSSAPAKFNIICGRGASKYFKEKQVPVVALSTNFPKNASDSLHVTMEDLKMKGMNFAMLQEFYHELGHSLHSISCSNEFQTYSGTRVPVDLAEIPSHVFEHFVTDFQFVKTWAVHKNSKELIEEGYFQYLLGRSQEFPALQRHMQLGVALFDLYLHSSPCLEKAVQMFETRHKSQEFQGNWFCSVEHFVEYGSCYYSYILDEAISNVIWETVYNKKTFNGNAGKVFFDQLLSQGGSIDPQKQINNLLKPFLIEDQSDSQDVDPFYLMEFWFKKFFADSQLVSLDKLRAENRVFYK
jgi:intermediate peptidase